jgi:hypothetical protein
VSESNYQTIKALADRLWRAGTIVNTNPDYYRMLDHADFARAAAILDHLAAAPPRWRLHSSGHYDDVIEWLDGLADLMGES